MPIVESEAVASLKILVAIAMADGHVDADERKALSSALVSFELPFALSLESLFAETVDVDAELAKVTSAEGREQLYRSAHFLARADGRASTEEGALLDRVAAATSPSEQLIAELARLAPSPSRRSAFVESLRGLFRSKPAR
jgi:tellurite resistance protein